MEYLLYNIISMLREKMPELSYIDEDYGQLENLDSETDMYPITFPCVLVDAPDIAWSEIQGGYQKGTATIRVRLCIDCYDDTHSNSGTLDAIKTRQEMSNKLHLLLQQYTPENDGAPMIRTNSSFSTANHGIKVYEHDYSVTVTQYDNDHTWKTVTPVITATGIIRPEQSGVFDTPFAETYD